MNVETTVTGDEEAERRLRDLAERATDVRPALHRIADLIQRDQAQNFASGGGKFGKWPALAAATAKRKGNATPLVATGALERAMQPGRGKGRVRRVTKTKITAGTSLFYARFHQAHGRPVVGITTVRGKVAARLVERYITHGRL